MRCTVVVPTVRGHERLRPLLDALSRQTVGRAGFDVILVDDGGPKIPESFLREYVERLRVQVLTIPNGGPGAARNRGIKAAVADWISFTDDDCVPEPEWLEGLGRALESQPEALVGGALTNLLPTNVYSEASHLLVKYLYTYYNRDPLDSRFLASNNLAARRDTLIAAGGFDETTGDAAGEDRELCDRWRGLNQPVLLVEDAVMGHEHLLTLRSFIRQHWYYGRGARRYHASRRARDQGPLFVESLGFYTGLVSIPWREPSQVGRVRLSALLLLSQFVNALAFFTEVFRHRGLSWDPILLSDDA